MAKTMSAILAEISSMENATKKVASAKQDKPDDKLLNFLDKLAMELDEDASKTESKKEEEEKEEDEEEEEEEDKEEENPEKEAPAQGNPFLPKAASAKKPKEGSSQMNEEKLAAKITNRVLAMLEKVAVGGVDNAGSLMPQSGTGDNNPSVLMSAIEDDAAIDQSKPNIGDAEVTTPTADLVEGVAPNSQSQVEPLQKGASVTISAEEAEVLQKLASIGYRYAVEVVSDQIVMDKIAEAVAVEKAKDAPTKIARALIAQERGETKTVKQSAREKLASAAEKNPDVLAALQILNNHKLL